MSSYLPNTPPRPVSFERLTGDIWRNVSGLWRSSSFVANTTSMTSGFMPSTGNPETTFSTPLIQVPASPVEFLVIPDYYFPPSGITMGQLSVTWQTVYLDTEESSIYGVTYEVWGQPTGTDTWRLLASTGEPRVSFIGLDAGSSWDLRVRGVSAAGVVGGWSETITSVLPADETPPPQPSMPTTESHLGSLKISWDGTWENSEDVTPRDFFECQIHYSMVDDFDPDNTTLLGSYVSPSGGTFTATNLEYNQEYFIKLVAIDYTGNRSVPSNPVSAIPRQLVGPDIVDNAIDLARLDVDARGAIETAQATADGKNTAYWSATEPTVPKTGTSFVVEDIWYDTSNDNALYRWNGSAWISALFGSGAFDTNVNDMLYAASVAVVDSVIEYATAASETVAPVSGWSTTTPTRTPGSYIWMRTLITYGDATTSLSNPVLLTGNDGADGTSGAPAQVIVLTASAQVLSSPAAGGTTTPSSTTITGTAQNTTISSWTYSVDGSAFSATVPTGVSRTDNVVTITGSTMTAKTIAVKASDISGNADTLTLAKVFDGADGAAASAGADAYTVLLTNESHTFPGSVSAALAGSTTSTVVTYKGATQSSATVGTITGQVTGLTTAVTNNGTNAPLITVTVTTALVTKNGELTIPITVDGKTFTKVFSWSVSYTGSQGIQGPDGNSLYTWLKYATTPTTGMSDLPDGKDYIGLAYNKTSSTESTNYADYSWSLIKGEEGIQGPSGANAITGVLSNESASVPADSSGAVSSFAAAVTTMYVFNGSLDDSANWTFAQAVSNCTATPSGTPANRTATLTAMSADTATVTITASRSGYDNIVKTFTVTKTKSGAAGANATSYWLMADAGVVAKSLAGTYTPASINVTGRTQVGTGTPAAYAGRFVIAETTGGAYVDRYTSATNESTKNYVPNSGVTAIRIRMYLAGGTTTLLDEIIVPIVSDGPVGSSGVSLRNRGTWSSATAYVNDSSYIDVVTHNGATYMAAASNTNSAPPNANWTLIAQNGTNGENGTNGTNGTNGKTYVLTINSSVGGVIYDANGANPSPSLSAMSCTLYENGTVVTPATYSWSVPASNTLLSGSSTAATFTPTLASTFSATAGNNVVSLSVTYAGQTVKSTFSISAGKIGTSGSDGTNGNTYALVLTGGVRNITFDANGSNPSPAQSAWGCTLYRDGVTVTPTSYSWTANGHLSGTSTTAAFTPTCSGTFNASNNDYVTLTVAHGGNTIVETATVAVSRIGTTGSSGANAVIGILNNESATVPASSSGTVSSFTTAVATMSIYEGDTDVTSSWAFAQVASNCTVTASGTPANRTATLTAMSTDTATVTFTATRSGYPNIVKVFTIVKSKAGVDGTTPTSYWLVSDAVAIGKTIAGVYTPASINITAKSQVGTGTPANYSGRFIIADTTDGTAYTDRYTSAANEATKNYVPSAGIKALRVRMYLAGGTTTLLDEMIIPVVSDGATGDPTYTWVKYADDGVGTNMSDSPTGKTYIGLAFNKTTSTESTTAGDYAWSLIQGPQGTAAQTVTLSATTQVLSSPSAGGATTPATSVVTGTAVGTTITQRDCSIDGGAWGAFPAWAVLAGDQVTITGSTMTAKTITVRMRNAAGTALDTITVAKVTDGSTGTAGSSGYTVLLTNEAHTFPGDVSNALAGSATTSVIAYKGTVAQTITVGTITGQVTGLTASVTAGQGTTSPTITVQATTALVTQGGTLTIPLTVDSVAFTKTFAWTVAYKGTAGTPGAAAQVVTLTATSQVLSSPAAGGATTPATSTVTGTAVGTTISTWDCSIDGGTFTTFPAWAVRTGNQVVITGSTMTAKTITVRMSNGGTAVDTITVAKVSDGAAGSTGTDGDAGYTVLLTNESHTFAGDVSNALAGSTTTTAVAYKGTVAQSINVTGITGQVTGLTASVTSGNNTTAPVITVTVTTALVTKNGTLNVAMTIDGVSFTKVFAWSVAYKGSTGPTGNTGVGIASITPYYLQQPTAEAAPALPSASPPANDLVGGQAWTTTEPSYVAGTSLYRTERILYTNSNFAYTEVVLVSSYAAATQAITAANGKNTIVHSTAVASNPANYIAGDTWFQYNGTNEVIAQWRHTGSAWQSETITSQVITNLDAAVITAGTITGTKLAANTITADKITVGDGNVVAGNIFLSVAEAFSGTSVVNSAYLVDGKKLTSDASALMCTFSTGFNNNNAAEVSYLEVDLKASYRIGQSKLYFNSADTRHFWYKIKYSTDNTNWFYAVGNATNTGWVISAKPTANGTPNSNPTINNFPYGIVARYIRVYGNGNSTGTAGTSNGTNQLYEWELFCAPPTTIEGGRIATGTIDASKVTVSNLDAGTALVGTLNAERIGSNTITAEKLNVLAKNHVLNFSAQGYAEGEQPPNWTTSASVTIDKTKTISSVTGATARTVDSLEILATSGNTEAASDAFEVNPNEDYSFTVSVLSTTALSTKMVGVTVYNSSMVSIGAYVYDVATKTLGTTLTTDAVFWSGNNISQWLKIEGRLYASGTPVNQIEEGVSATKHYVFPPDAKYVKVNLRNYNASPTYGDGVTASSAYFYSPVVTKTKSGIITADSIVAGTIDAKKVNIINFSADMIKGGKIDAGLIDADSITADMLAIGALTPQKASSDFGKVVDLAENPSVTNKADAQDVVDLSDSVAALQGEVGGRLSAFSFTTGQGAVITTGTYSVAITGERMSFRQGSTEVAYITGSKLYITSAEVLDNIVVGDFLIDKEGSNTLIRWNS